MAVRARPDNLALDHPVGERPLDFDELWNLRDELRAVSHRMVGDAGHADDVVQDTFLRALANAERLDRRGSYAPWLATVARRRSIDELRGRSRLRLVAAAPEPTPSHPTDPLEQILQQEALDRVRVALDELSPRERQLLLRQVTHGLTLAELAAEEATTVASVRSVLTRARTKLRAAVERDGPLGAAPLPGLVAAVKRRLHRWASRLESRTPLLAGVGTQLGDVAVAAIAAIAVLVAGAATGASGTELGTRLHALAASAEAESNAASPGGDAPGKRPTTTTTTSSTTTTTMAPGAVPPPDWSVIPTLPGDGHNSMGQTNVSTFAVSADRRVVFAMGLSGVGTGNVLRSADNGVTWEHVPAPPGDYRLLVPPTYPAEPTLFFLEADALLRSDDDGRHFYPVAPTRLGLVAFAPGYAHSRRVLIAGNPLLEYEASAFPGTLRPLLAAPPSTELGGIVPGWDYDAAGTTLIGSVATQGTSRTSTVYACTPTACTPHATLAGAKDPPKVFRSVGVPGVVLAWWGQRMMRSDDGGRTFAPVTLSGISVDAVVDGAPGELFLTGNNLATASTVHRSTDGGRTWQPFATGTPLADATRAITRLASGRLLAAAVVGSWTVGVHCSDDDGATWSFGCS